jgi:hypothetical protein
VKKRLAPVGFCSRCTNRHQNREIEACKDTPY